MIFVGPRTQLTQFVCDWSHRLLDMYEMISTKKTCLQYIKNNIPRIFRAVLLDLNVPITWNHWKQPKQQLPWAPFFVETLQLWGPTTNRVGHSQTCCLTKTTLAPHVETKNFTACKRRVTPQYSSLKALCDLPIVQSLDAPFVLFFFPFGPSCLTLTNCGGMHCFAA